MSTGEFLRLESYTLRPIDQVYINEILDHPEMIVDNKTWRRVVMFLLEELSK